MLLSCGFNDQSSFPFTQLLRHLGTAEWERRREEFNDPEILEEFATCKVKELEHHEETLERVEEKKELLDNGEMTKEEFIAQCTPFLQDRGYL